MSGTVADRSVVQQVLERYERAVAWPDPAVFVTVAGADAVARAAAQVDPAAPLAGLTFAVKDNVDVAGLPTTAGCPPYHRVPEVSSPVVRRLEAAGAVCVGKTNLDQFATGLVGTRSPYGTPVNPVDPLLAPGGSSSGSAVAVAAGLVDFALGTDTAGSGRVPAAQCRITGLKPTRGLLSTSGVVPAVRSLDCVSFLAADVAGAWRCFASARWYDPADPFSRTAPRGVPSANWPHGRVGVVIDPDLDSSEDRSAWKQTLAQLSNLGVDLVEVDAEPFLAAARLLYGGGWVAERYAAVGEFLDEAARRGQEGIDPTVASIIGGARSMTAVDVYRSAYRLAELRRATEAAWAAIDALLLPTTPGVATLAEIHADPVGRNTRLGTYTNFVNLFDLCAVAVPGADRPDGRPFGVQVIGPAFTDASVAALAALLSGEPPPAPSPGPDAPVDLVVVGAHLSGQALNVQLTERGGRLVASTTTTAEYRLYALAATPPRPGLVRVGSGGAAIEVEVWRMPAEEVGSLLHLIPPPLGIGPIRLADGSTRAGFLCEQAGLDGAADITAHGGWRAYLASRP